jgi:hypothetical protein
MAAVCVLCLLPISVLLIQASLKKRNNSSDNNNSAPSWSSEKNLVEATESEK